jgi:hypothetical protein
MFETFLDYFATYPFVYYISGSILFVVLGFLVMFRLQKHKGKTPLNAQIGIAVFFIVFFLSFAFGILNPATYGYGYMTNGYEDIVNDKNIIWRLDYKTTSGGDASGSSISYRIQGIDAVTGKKLFRKVEQNKIKILGVKNNIVWTDIDESIADEGLIEQKEGVELIGMDLFTGENKIVINEKYLKKYFPEYTSSGVYKIKFNSKTTLVDIVTKDGFDFSFDPNTNKKIETPISSEEE